MSSSDGRVGNTKGPIGDLDIAWKYKNTKKKNKKPNSYSLGELTQYKNEHRVCISAALDKFKNSDKLKNSDKFKKSLFGPRTFDSAALCALRIARYDMIPTGLRTAGIIPMSQTHSLPRAHVVCSFPDYPCLAVIPLSSVLYYCTTQRHISRKPRMPVPCPQTLGEWGSCIWCWWLRWSYTTPSLQKSLWQFKRTFVQGQILTKSLNLETYQWHQYP